MPHVCVGKGGVRRKRVSRGEDKDEVVLRSVGEQILSERAEASQETEVMLPADRRDVANTAVWGQTTN